jgi:hypothetical protein
MQLCPPLHSYQYTFAPHRRMCQVGRNPPSYHPACGSLPYFCGTGPAPPRFIATRLIFYALPTRFRLHNGRSSPQPINEAANSLPSLRNSASYRQDRGQTHTVLVGDRRQHRCRGLRWGEAPRRQGTDAAVRRGMQAAVGRLQLFRTSPDGSIRNAGYLRAPRLAKCPTPCYIQPDFSIRCQA